MCYILSFPDELRIFVCTGRLLTTVKAGIYSWDKATSMTPEQCCLSEFSTKSLTSLLFLFTPEEKNSTDVVFAGIDPVSLSSRGPRQSRSLRVEVFASRPFGLLLNAETAE